MPAREELEANVSKILSTQKCSANSGRRMRKWLSVRSSVWSSKRDERRWKSNSENAPLQHFSPTQQQERKTHWLFASFSFPTIRPVVQWTSKLTFPGLRCKKKREENRKGFPFVFFLLLRCWCDRTNRFPSNPLICFSSCAIFFFLRTDAQAIKMAFG